MEVKTWNQKMEIIKGKDKLKRTNIYFNEDREKFKIRKKVLQSNKIK